MKLTIFDVEHGACALVATNTGCHAVIDCGYNSTTNWRPSVALPAMGIFRIDELIITNCDEDHVNDLPNLRKTVAINILSLNRSVSPTQLFQLKSEDCAPGKGIQDLIVMAADYSYPVVTQPNWGEITFKSYWNQYPTDFVDENNLSLAQFIHHPRLSILFPE